VFVVVVVVVVDGFFDGRHVLVLDVVVDGPRKGRSRSRCGVQG
jgi:hypothetical protein